MDDGIEALEVTRFDLADVLAQGRHVDDGAARRVGAALVKIGVEAADRVAGLDQHRHHDRADVPL